MKKPSAIGRPPKAAADKYRTPMRSIRIPDDLWQAIAEAAQSKGQTVSDWIREACAAEVKRGRKE